MRHEQSRSKSLVVRKLQCHHSAYKKHNKDRAMGEQFYVMLGTVPQPQDSRHVLIFLSPCSGLPPRINHHCRRGSPRLRFRVEMANGECSKGVNCSFRHDMNKRANSTQPNPSRRSSTQQSERNASRTTSPRGRSPSGNMARLPCKDYLKKTCTTPFCEKWHPPECLFYKTKSGCRFGEKCSYAHPPG